MESLMAGLAADEVHLWLLDEREAGPLREYEALLNAEEARRWQRFQRQSDRQRFLLTRVALRLLLSRYVADTQPAQWCFRSNAHGRPELIRHPLAGILSFNISHSDGLIAIALSRDAVCGVDVETRRRMRRLRALSQRYFAESECSMLQALDEAAEKECFYDLWTLKEAYVKACGKGLAIPLSSFSFSFSSSFSFPGTGISLSTAQSQQAIASGPWQFWQFDPMPDYSAALALRGKPGSRLRSFSLRLPDQVEEIVLQIKRQT